MALKLEQLKELSEEQIIDTAIQYSVALDTANTSIVKLQDDLKNLDSIKSLTKKQLEELKELKKLKDEIIIVNDKLKMVNDNNINLISQIEESNKKNILLQNIIKEKDSEILLIKNKNKESKLPTQNNGIIHTYNIKGFDNRTGLEINGGATYIKAVIIVKMVNDVLYWEIRSHDLDLNINRSLDLAEYKNDSNSPDSQEKVRIVSLEARTKDVGSYTAIKEFLQIPEMVENGFNKNTLLISGGI